VPGIVVTTEGAILAYGEARKSTGGDWGAIDILMCRSTDRGEIVVSPTELKNPSETVAVQLHDGRLMLNIRHAGEPHRRAVSFSPDGISDWSPVRFDETLFEPVCMGSIVRLSERPPGASMILAI
jgi:hypothetical protein